VRTLSGLPLARAAVLRWPDPAVPPCAVPAAVRLRSVAMAVRPYVALLVMSRFAAATAGHITAAGMVRVLSPLVLPWGRQRVLQPHRRPTIPVIRIIIRRLIKPGFPGWIGS